jgi:thioredoxin-like negative regulator of GroEL
MSDPRGIDAEVLVVTAPGCPNCRAMAPLVESATRTHDGVVAVVPVDASGDPERARQLGVRGVPTYIARHDGVEVARTTGRMSGRELDTLFAAAASGAGGASRTTRADRALRLAAAAAFAAVGVVASSVPLLCLAVLVAAYGVWDLVVPG